MFSIDRYQRDITRPDLVEANPNLRRDATCEFNYWNKMNRNQLNHDLSQSYIYQPDLKIINENEDYDANNLLLADGHNSVNIINIINDFIIVTFKTGLLMLFTIGFEYKYKIDLSEPIIFVISGNYKEFYYIITEHTINQLGFESPVIHSTIRIKRRIISAMCKTSPILLLDQYQKLYDLSYNESKNTINLHYRYRFKAQINGIIELNQIFSSTIKQRPSLAYTNRVVAIVDLSQNKEPLLYEYKPIKYSLKPRYTLSVKCYRDYMILGNINPITRLGENYLTIFSFGNNELFKSEIHNDILYSQNGFIRDFDIVGEYLALITYNKNEHIELFNPEIQRIIYDIIIPCVNVITMLNDTLIIGTSADEVIHLKLNQEHKCCTNCKIKKFKNRQLFVRPFEICYHKLPEYKTITI